MQYDDFAKYSTVLAASYAKEPAQIALHCGYNTYFVHLADDYQQRVSVARQCNPGIAMF